MLCFRCNRELTDPSSMKAGIGPVCAAHQRPSEQDMFSDEKAHRVRGFFHGDVILIRDPDGVPVVNLEQTVAYHSPTGFEWGYGGSGPADLALNILLRFTDANTARVLHQDFKWRFVTKIPHAGGTIRGEDIKRWLEKKCQESSGESED